MLDDDRLAARSQLGIHDATLASPSMMVKLRTRLLMLLMRLADHERLTAWHARGLLRAPRGEVQITGGPGVKLRLARFAFWGAQSYGVITGEHERQVQEA